MNQDTGAESSTIESVNSTPIEAVESAVKGENPYTFRVAQAQYDSPATPSVRFEGPVERTIDDMVTLSPTVTEHEAIIGVPFSASYFNMNKHFASIDETDRANFRAIDEYIVNKIDTGRFRNTAEAGVDFLIDLSEKLKLKSYHDPFYRASKMAKYLKALNNFTQFSAIRTKLIKGSDDIA